MVQDLFVAAKAGLKDIDEAADELHLAMVSYLQVHKAVYDRSLIRPKVHWMLDIPAQLKRDRLIIDAFVIERQHLLVKRVSEHIKNLSQFEDSVLASVLVAQLHEAKELVVGDQLVGRTTPLDGCRDAMVANKLAIHSVEYSVDDVVARGSDVGVIIACAIEAGVLYALVSPFVLVDHVSRNTSKFSRTPGLAVWLAADIQHVLAWMHGRGSVFVIRR